MPNSIDTPRLQKSKPIRLIDLAYNNDLLQYRRCTHCGEAQLHTYTKETTLACEWTTVCLNCNAHYGYAWDQHVEIEQRLLNDGWTERGLRAMRDEVNSMNIPVGEELPSLLQVIEQINEKGVGKEVAS